MSALSISPPFPIFTDIDGQPLENGYVWIGTANLNPITNPINVYWDAALTIPAAQPIRTLGGYPINNGTPARLYVSSDYSIQVQNRNGSVVYSAPVDTEFMSSANISYLPAGTGAVATTVQAKLRESVSVFDFMTAAQIADVQAGTALVDVTAALNVAVNSFPKVGIYTSNMSLLFPKGTYRISEPINFPTGILSYPVITFEGQIFQTSATADCLVFDQVFYGNISGVHCNTTWDSWLNDRSAVKFNTLANTNLGIAWATNFNKGLHLNAGPGATAYNEIHLSYMRNCKYGVYGTPDGTVSNFINANTFYGGNFENSYKATVSGDVGVYINGNNFGNSFYDQIFESVHTAFNLTNSNGFLVSKIYFEQTDLVADLSGAASGTWIHGHQDFTQATFTTNSQTRRIIFLNTGVSTDATVASMEVDYSGVRFKQYVAGDANNNPSITLGYQPYSSLNCLTITDHHGGNQRINKDYETSTGSPPTVGTFTNGAIAWNNTGTIGQPSGWLCRQLGTAGTLVGVTGNATLGSPVVTVNSAANLKPGMYITVAGGAFAANQIDYIVGNTVTMTSNSGATVTGAAVTYFAPLWRALANFA